MKITRAMIGKYVEIQWMDPCFNSRPIENSPVGRAALATWQERGVIVDITDGIIKIEHSHETHAESKDPDGDDHSYTPVPETLIEKLTIFNPETPLV